MIQSNRNRFTDILVFVAAALVLLIHHLYAYTGHYGYDDIHYAKLANELMLRRMDFSDHYSFRWPILVLTACSFKLFGINDFASALPSLVISFCTLFIVYIILKSHGIKALIFGLGLTVLDGWSLHYSDKIMPDTYINLGVMLLVYCIVKYKYSPDGAKSLRYAVGFAFSFLYGFMAKESMLLVLPFIFYLFVVDMALKRDIRFWKYAGLMAMLLYAVYFGFTAYLTGSALQRFVALSNNPYLSLCSYNQQSLTILLKRISYQFFALLINKGMFIAPAILLTFLLSNWKRQILLFKDEQSFYLISFILLLLSCNFMSASMTAYNPLCLDPRHYLFLVPVAAIFISQSYNKLFLNFKTNLVYVFVFIFLSIITFINSKQEFQFLYFPMLILIIANLIFYQNKKFILVFPFVFVFILFFKLFDKVRYTKELNYEAQKKVVMEQFIAVHKKAYVITDDVQKRLGEYYNGFGIKSDIRFLRFDAFKFDTLDQNMEKYVLLNKYTQGLSNLEKDELPYYAFADDSSRFVYDNEALHIRILKLDEVSEPVSLLHYETGFENAKDSPDYSGTSLSNQKVHSGIFSNKIEEYSYTFKYALDSIHFNNDQNLLIQSKLFFLKDKPSKANMVISVDEKDAPYIYESQVCDHYVKAFSVWNQVRFSLRLDSKKIKPGSTLKIYIWNQEKTEMYMDDMEVNLSIIERKPR